MALFFFHNRMINFKCLLQRCGPLVGLERKGEGRRGEKRCVHGGQAGRGHTTPFADYISGGVEMVH